MYDTMQNIQLMSCNGKDPQQMIICSINGDISFASLYRENAEISKLVS